MLVVTDKVLIVKTGMILRLVPDLPVVVVEMFSLLETPLFSKPL